MTHRQLHFRAGVLSGSVLHYTSGDSSSPTHSQHPQVKFYYHLRFATTAAHSYHMVFSEPSTGLAFRWCSRFYFIKHTIPKAQRTKNKVCKGIACLVRTLCYTQAILPFRQLLVKDGSQPLGKTVQISSGLSSVQVKKGLFPSLGSELPLYQSENLGMNLKTGSKKGPRTNFKRWISQYACQQCQARGPVPDVPADFPQGILGLCETRKEEEAWWAQPCHQDPTPPLHWDPCLYVAKILLPLCPHQQLFADTTPPIKKGKARTFLWPPYNVCTPSESHSELSNISHDHNRKRTQPPPLLQYL